MTLVNNTPNIGYLKARRIIDLTLQRLEFTRLAFKWSMCLDVSIPHIQDAYVQYRCINMCTCSGLWECHVLGCHWLLCSCSIEKCKSMDSKMKPLWMVYRNADPYGSDVLEIFKQGDGM